MFRSNFLSLQIMMIFVMIFFVVGRVDGAEPESIAANKRLTPAMRIELLREICGADSSADKGNLKKEINGFSLDELVALRNFTQQQGFSNGSDSCYMKIDELMDARLASAVIDLYYKPVHDELSYDALKKLKGAVGKIIFEKINKNQFGKEIADELAMYSQKVPTSARRKYEYEQGNLNSYLDAIKNLVELKIEQRAAMQVKVSERKKWFWQRWFGW